VQFIALWHDRHLEYVTDQDVQATRRCYGRAAARRKEKEERKVGGKLKKFLAGRLVSCWGVGPLGGRAKWGLRGLKVCLLFREVTIQISYEVNVCIGGILLYQDML